MTFKTKEELLEQARRDGACYPARQWANKQPDLETIFRECRTKWRLWALERRYEQFTEHCKWDELTGSDWAIVLRWYPQFADRCDWSKLNEDSLRWLLEHHPELINYVNKKEE